MFSVECLLAEVWRSGLTRWPDNLSEHTDMCSVGSNPTASAELRIVL